MMHNPVAAQEYNTDMSGLWFGHNLHGYNSLSTGSRLSRARRLRCNDWPRACDSLFQGSVAQSPGPPIPVNTQSWSRYLPPDKTLHKHICPPTLHQQPQLHLLHPRLFFFKLFLYHTSVSRGDQYRCDSLGLQKCVCLQVFACKTAIDPLWFGPVPDDFNVCGKLHKVFWN